MLCSITFNFYCCCSLSFSCPSKKFLIVLFYVFNLVSDDTLKSHRSRNRVHKSSGLSQKTVCRSLSSESQSKGSICRSTVHESSNPCLRVVSKLESHCLLLKSPNVQKVDLSKLEMAALRRYWRHFNLVSLCTMTFFFLGSNREIHRKKFWHNGYYLGGCYSKPLERAANRSCSEAFHVAGTFVRF